MKPNLQRIGRYWLCSYSPNNGRDWKVVAGLTPAEAYWKMRHVT